MNYTPISSAARKTIFCVNFNIEKMLQRFGVENCAFMTVTLTEKTHDAKEAKVKIDRILRSVIRKRYSHYLGVLERHRDGAIHYHFVVHVGRDVRTGFSWRALRRKEYYKLPKNIREEWAWLREQQATCKDFGWFRLEPVKAGAAAMARYLTKYLVKGIQQRTDKDKGVRLYRASNGIREATTRFMWVNEKTTAFRWKLGAILRETGMEYGDLSKKFGQGWAQAVIGVVGEAPIEDLFSGDWVIPEYVRDCLGVESCEIHGNYGDRIGFFDPIWFPKEWPGVPEDVQEALSPKGLSPEWPYGYTFREREIETWRTKEDIHTWLQKFEVPNPNLWREELARRKSE